MLFIDMLSCHLQLYSPSVISCWLFYEHSKSKIGCFAVTIPFASNSRNAVERGHILYMFQSSKALLISGWGLDGGWGWLFPVVKYDSKGRGVFDHTYVFVSRPWSNFAPLPLIRHTHNTWNPIVYYSNVCKHSIYWHCYAAICLIKTCHYCLVAVTIFSSLTVLESDGNWYFTQGVDPNQTTKQLPMTYLNTFPNW